jgi:hypothetical protein
MVAHAQEMHDLTLLQARVNAAKSRRGRKLLAIMSEVDKVGKDQDFAVLDSILSDALVPPEARAIEDVQTGVQAGAKGKTKGCCMPDMHKPLLRSHLTLTFTHIQPLGRGWREQG